MAEATIVEGEDVDFVRGALGEGAVGVGAPALGNGAGVAVDFWEAGVVSICLVRFVLGEGLRTADYEAALWIFG